MATYAQKIERPNKLVQMAELSYAAAKRVAASRGTSAAVRHECFISYHGADIDGVTDFVEQFNDVFIPRVVGASDSDHFKGPVTSEDEDYIKAQIGSRYLADSTVTILYVGACAWTRKYVDWELSSSLRNDPVNKRNGSWRSRRLNAEPTSSRTGSSTTGRRMTRGTPGTTGTRRVPLCCGARSSS